MKQDGDDNKHWADACFNFQSDTLEPYPDVRKRHELLWLRRQIGSKILDINIRQPL
jgi:hypothetical protein